MHCWVPALSPPTEVCVPSAPLDTYAKPLSLSRRALRLLRHTLCNTAASLPSPPVAETRFRRRAFRLHDPCEARESKGFAVHSPGILQRVFDEPAPLPLCSTAVGLLVPTPVFEPPPAPPSPPFHDESSGDLTRNTKRSSPKCKWDTIILDDGSHAPGQQ